MSPTRPRRRAASIPRRQQSGSAFCATFTTCDIGLPPEPSRSFSVTSTIRPRPGAHHPSAACLAVMRREGQRLAENIVGMRQVSLPEEKPYCFINGCRQPTLSTMMSIRLCARAIRRRALSPRIRPL